jgi:outer membrane receptor protein involved in Fe transport
MNSPNYPLHSGVRQLQVSLLALLLMVPLSAQEAKTEVAKPEPKAAAPTTAEVTQAAATARTDEEVIQLTPFTVTNDRDQGYFAENTLAGSRLNTNLADVAASITVVTKQQMEDTASVDINDVFKFEANTEGSGTYTPLITDRGTAKDSVAGYTLGNDGGTTTNAQSNRVRGLGVPDAAMNYYPTNNRIPFDAYNTQSVEISRGPNSLLFGLGSPAGIVNQSTAQAVLNRDTNNVQVRTDHNGSFRGSFAFNRSIIDNKLALYMGFLYNDQRFERKPASDLTNRQFAAITFKPFPKTVIRAFAEGFENKANRPNSLTPRDFVTPWLQSGRPVYDPITRSVTRLDTGVVTGPYVFSTLSPGYVAGSLANASNLTATTSSQYVPGIIYDQVARPLMRVDNGVFIDLFQRQPTLARTAWTNPEQTNPTPANQGWVAQDPRYAIQDRQWTSSGALPAPTVTIGGVTYTQGTYQNAGVTNQSIYDWTEYNTNEANFGYLRAGNYNVELEQELLPNLFLNAGWFRQDIDSAENYTISQLTGATLTIDTNVKKPDGSANAYLGLPYINDYTPDTFYQPETVDNYRAMLAYDMDFSKREDWMSILGKHRLLGMWSKQDSARQVERWRMNFVNADGLARYRYMNNPLLNNGFNRWNAGQGYLQRNYYMGSPGGSYNVTKSTGYFGNPGWDSPYTVPGGSQIYNYASGLFETYPVTYGTYFSDAGSYRTQREVESYNLALQSYIWKNRLIATVGWRRDDYRARRTTTGAIQNPDLTTAAIALTANQIYDPVTGITKYDLVMNRWNRWDELTGDTKTIGVAARPFYDWNKSGASPSQLRQFADGLTFYYNKSDNFNPPATFQTDLFFKPLPKPTGKGEDIGLGFNMLDNKLVVRLNWFENTNQDERTGAADTLLTRLLYGDTTLMQPWATAVVRLRNGANPGVNNWNSDTVNPLTSAMHDQIWALMKLPRDYYAGLSRGGTQDSQATGYEAQITYNPTRNWTMKLTGAKQETTYQNIAPQYDAWYAVRKPVWDAATAPEIPDFTDAAGTQYSLRNFWTSYGYTSAARLSNTDGNTNAQLYFDNTVVSQIGLAKALEGVMAPNQRKYRGSFITNYNFSEGRLRGFSVGGSERWESKAAVGFKGKAADPTRPTVLTASDPNQPVYFDNGNYYTDFWFTYRTKVWNDKFNMKIQLNVNNVFESGSLVPIAVNYDGTPWAFRIIDPRQFILTTTFDF